MESTSKKYKIAITGDCLGQGGAEKVHALLSQYFVSKNIDVCNIILEDLITYPYSGNIFILSHFKTSGNSIFNKINRFIKFKKYIADNKFDFIIDFRMKQFALREILISKLIYKVPTCYVISSGILGFYMPKPLFASRFIYSNKKISTVSLAIENQVRKLLNEKISTIYNPIDFHNILIAADDFSPTETNYIVAVGRMNDTVKQFDHLIQAYSKSVLPNNTIKLLILGDGENRPELQKLASDLELEELVIFKGFHDNPYPFMKNALFMVLSSRNEGFPNVLIESLAVGIPVVSYDCFTGPSEIITDRENGLLVENQNTTKLTEAMNLFVEDQILYNHCKSNANASVQRFSLEIIGRQWLDLMKINVN